MSAGRCPNSTDSGCRCWEHHPGLSAYCPDHARDAYNAILASTRQPTSTTQPTAIPAEPCHGYANGCICPDCSLRSNMHAEVHPKPIKRRHGQCDGTMTCRCSRCTHERKLRIQLGTPQVSQPWVPRPARKARKAAWAGVTPV